MTMLMRPTPEPAVETIRDIARHELAAAGGLKEHAIAALTARIESDLVLRHQIAAEAIEIAIVTMTSRNIRSERESILRAVGAGREGVKALASGIVRTVLDTPLFDGTKLRDANDDDLKEAIRHYRTQAIRMSAMASFLGAVAKKVPSGKKVGDVLTDEEANNLWRKHAR